MTNVILCGGSGTRLWPLSRSGRPKQFLPMFDGKTLFEKTLLRNRGLAGRFLILTVAELEPLVRGHLDEMGMDAEIVIEPVGRNTAPAITLACLGLSSEETVLVTPSDHLIENLAEYQAAVSRGLTLAGEDFLVTFGIQPTHPETGYGYIELDGERVISFREKPDEATARAYCQDGRHQWNSGMFLFKAGRFLSEMERWAPDVLAACREAGPRPTKSAMERIPSISVDYAVFEKSARVRVVSRDLGWSDVGSFDSLAERLPVSADGNSHTGDAEPLFHSSRNNLVISGQRKVVLIDVEDLVVVDTSDALLVMKKGSGQKVKPATDIIRRDAPRLL